jgi:lipoyltransferase 1
VFPKNSGESIPIVSSLIGKPYDENNFAGIVSALKGVSSDNVKQAMGL